MNSIFRWLYLTLLCWIIPFSVFGATRDSRRLLAGAARQAARGDTATALQVIEHFLAEPGRDETKPAAMYLKGVLVAARNQPDTAEAVLRQMIVEYPESDRIGLALTQLGLICSRQGRDTVAVRFLEPVAYQFPDSDFTGPALTALARSAERSKLTDKAIQAYLQYLRRPVGDEHQATALEHAAELLYGAGRVRESYALIERIRGDSKKEFADLPLNTQILAIGCLTGLGKPDSSLRLAEEIRRKSGEGPLDSPRLRFLLGHAWLAQAALGSADSIFTGLASVASLPSEGIRPDSLYHLLCLINLQLGKNENYFAWSRKRLETLDDPQIALEILQGMAETAGKAGTLEPVLEGLGLYERRFGSAEAQLRQEKLLKAIITARQGNRRDALRILEDLGDSGLEPELQARVKLARIELYYQAGDSLRAEAELVEYLKLENDPLHDRDSLLFFYAGVKGRSGNAAREKELLEQLTGNYPASRYWEQAHNRLEEIALFESARPAKAADDLLDILERQGGQVSAPRLAEIAAEELGDYERAVTILMQNPPQAPEERLKLIRYRFLSGLKLKQQGSVEGNERVAQSWREIRFLLAQEKNFPARENALSTFLAIYRSIFGTLVPSQIQEADEQLKAELAGLDRGPVRAAVLCWLGERYEAQSRVDSSLGASAKADSARKNWAEAISIGGDIELSGRAILSLANSLEGASFAGARDSAATLYGQLLERYSGSRWASLAGLRLGIIHLLQDRYSLSYRVISDWAVRNPYATGDQKFLAALAETSFLTGRYARAVSVLDRVDPNLLDSRGQRVFAAYRIQALTRLGEYARATNRLSEFSRSYVDESSTQASWAIAVELFQSSGSPDLADLYLARLTESSPFYSAANIFALQGRLAAGGDLERLRKDFERFKKAPWNAFFRLDPAFEAYRGIMACLAGQGQLDKIAETRDEFRKSYPERRAALAELMLGEIEFLLAAGIQKSASTLNEDLKLLFQDVYPEDRALWDGYRLTLAKGDVPGANKQLSALAGRFPWSSFGVRAQAALARLYLDAGQPDRAQAILDELPREVVRPYVVEGLQASIAGARGDWDLSLALRRNQWARAPRPQAIGEVLLDWAESSVKALRLNEALDLLTGYWSPEKQLTGRARYLLALQYEAGKEHQKALGCLEGLIALYGGSGEPVLQALYQKGMVQEEMGQNEEAAKTYQLLESQASENSDWLRSARNRLKALSRQNGGSASNP